MVLLASTGHCTLTFSDKRQQFKIGLSQRENKGTIEWIESFRDRFHYKKIQYTEKWGEKMWSAHATGICWKFCHSNFHSEGRKEGHANQEQHSWPILLTVRQVDHQSTTGLTYVPFFKHMLLLFGLFQGGWRWDDELLWNNQAITTRHEELVQALLRSQLFEDLVMYFNPLESCRCVQITRLCLRWCSVACSCVKSLWLWHQLSCFQLFVCLAVEVFCDFFPWYCKNIITWFVIASEMIQTQAYMLPIYFSLC